MVVKLLVAVIIVMIVWGLAIWHRVKALEFEKWGVESDRDGWRARCSSYESAIRSLSSDVKNKSATILGLTDFVKEETNLTDLEIALKGGPVEIVKNELAVHKKHFKANAETIIDQQQKIDKLTLRRNKWKSMYESAKKDLDYIIEGKTDLVVQVPDKPTPGSEAAFLAGDASIPILDIPRDKHEGIAPGLDPLLRGEALLAGAPHGDEAQAR